MRDGAAPSNGHGTGRARKGMDVAQAEALLRAALPDLQIRSVEPMDEGWESLVLDVNGVLIAKVPRAAWAAEKYRREERLLAAIGPLLQIPVPRPRLIDGETPIEVYDKLPGEMLMGEVGASVDTASIGAQLGAFLRQLHALDDDVIARSELEPSDPASWVERWRSLSIRIEENVFPLLSTRAQNAARRLFASDLDDRLATFRPTITHGDVGGWNILVDPGTSTITAIIDWGDAEIADPAFDFTVMRAELPRPLFEAAVEAYGPFPDELFAWRLEIYAQMYPLYSALFASQVSRDEMRRGYLAMAEARFAGAG